MVKGSRDLSITSQWHSSRF